MTWRSHREKALSLAAATLAAVLIVSPLCGNGRSITAEAEPPSEGVLRIGFVEVVDSLNPFIGSSYASKIFRCLVYDCLYVVEDDLSVTSNLALDWRIAEAFEPYGSVWDFNVTPNARWHDGQPLTADDIVFTFNLASSNYTTMWAYQPYTYFVDCSEKIDQDTVRIRFYDRATGDPMAATHAESLFIPILPEHKLRDTPPVELAFKWMGVYNDTDPPLIGTGPFMATEDIYDELVQGDRISLVRNPNYHWEIDKEGSPSVVFDRLEMHFFDNSSAMVGALKEGRIDAARLPLEGYASLKADIENQNLTEIATCDGRSHTGHYSFVSINMNNDGPNPSRLDPVIRQAMAMATSKQYIIDNFYLGYGEVGTTLIPPVNEEWHYEPTTDELYEYDLDAASALLEAGGYRYTAESQDVRVCTADSYAVQENLVAEGTPLLYDLVVRQGCPEERDTAIFIQSEWSKIGIRTNPLIVSDYYFNRIVYCPFEWDIWIADRHLDADPNYALFRQSMREGGTWWLSGWNDNLYSSSEYEENYTRSVIELNDSLRSEYVTNCQRIQYRDVSYIILANIHQTYAWRTDGFAAWGDWDSNPGLSIDALWSANPLYISWEHTSDWPTMSALVVIGSVAIFAAAIMVFALSRTVRKARQKPPDRQA